MAPIFVIVAIINVLANMNNYNIPNDPELRNIRVRRDNVASINIKSIIQGDYYRSRAKRAFYNTDYRNNVTSTTTPYYSGNNINQIYNGAYQQYTGKPYSGTHMWQYNPYNIAPNNNNLQQSGYNQQQPVYNQQQPLYNQQQPVYNQQQPVYNQQQPIYNQQQPIYNQQQPLYNQQQPLYNQQQSVYNQQQPLYNQQQPITNNNNGYNVSNKVIPVTNGTQSKVTVETTTPRIACILCDIECPAFLKRVGFLCLSEEDEFEEEEYL